MSVMRSPGLPSSWLIKSDATAVYYSVPAEDLKNILTTELARESRLVWIFCTDESRTTEVFRLWYVIEEAERPEFIVLVVDTSHPESIASLYPVASYFERKIADEFGIRFEGSVDERRLLLHECYPEGFYPLRKTTKNGPVQTSEKTAPYEFRQVQGTAVYQVPVGPVHAGIIEPGHFRFSVIGETIVNLELRLGYLHRGIEKLAEGSDPFSGIRIAESISGDESAALACCYAMAIDTIASIRIPDRAAALRVILLELERSYSLLSDLAGMVTDVAFSAAAARFLIIREELQRSCEMITGSRFLKGILTVGGLSRDIPDDLLMALKDTVIQSLVDLEEVFTWTLSVPSVIDRFSTTGVVREPLIDPLALSGPIARASGRACDVRADHPYGWYLAHPPCVIFKRDGDVLARFSVKGEEIRASLTLIKEMIPDIPKGPVHVTATIRDGFNLSALESPRGRTLFWIKVIDGKIDRCAVSTASFCNWLAIEHAVMGNIVPDFPVINKSLNLSYAGTDL